jgi:hypothetical protein
MGSTLSKPVKVNTLLGGFEGPLTDASTRSRYAFMGVWQGVAMHSLEYRWSLPCPTLLSPAVGPLLKWPFQGWTAQRMGGLWPLSTPLDTPRCTPLYAFVRNFSCRLLKLVE